MTEDKTEAALRQEWRTPPALLEALAHEFTINIDVAASRENAVAQDFYDSEANGLVQPWFGRNYWRVAWCNPGFKDMGRWVDKAIAEVQGRPDSVALLLGLCAPSTRWWQLASVMAAEIRLLSPRPQFIAPPGIQQSSNARENALFVFRPLPFVRPGVLPKRHAHIWTWRWQEPFERRE